MSQNIRAESAVLPSFSGRIWNVDGSGRASMSLSLARVKPSIADPSKPMPSSNAPSSSAGAIATDFSVPRTSVNQRRTNRMLRSSMVRSTNSCWRSTALQSRREAFPAGYAARPGRSG